RPSSGHDRAGYGPEDHAVPGHRRQNASGIARDGDSGTDDRGLSPRGPGGFASEGTSAHATPGAHGSAAAVDPASGGGTAALRSAHAERARRAGSRAPAGVAAAAARGLAR